MCFSSLLGSAVAAGFACNHLDIAPRHAGALMGLSNTAGTIPGVIGVTFSGWLVDVTGSWRSCSSWLPRSSCSGSRSSSLFAKGRAAVRIGRYSSPS
jgi:ACS family sodium-dependent inorganic phosphate cotransporter